MRYIPIENSRQYVSGIYCIESDCGKKYIGSSIKLKMRCDTHRWELLKGVHDNKRLQNYVNKYGINTLLFYTLELCTKDKLIEREQFYIDSLNPFFNILKVAGNTTGNKPWQGRKHTEETKQKIKAGIAIAFANKPKKQKPVKLTREENNQRLAAISKTESARQRAKEHLTGHTYWLGRKHKFETIENRKGGLNGRARKVICKEHDLHFDCARDASKHFNLTNSAVTSSIKRGTKILGKYKFEYA